MWYSWGKKNQKICGEDLGIFGSGIFHVQSENKTVFFCSENYDRVVLKRAFL
jgi:ribosomal protein L24E